MTPEPLLKASLQQHPGLVRRRTAITSVLGGIIGVSLGLPLGTAQAQQSPAKSELRIGFQKYGTLTLLKAKGDLEKRLAPLGVTVKWNEFPAGPQLLEGLNVGSIDFGTVGEAPPIFAQAAKTQRIQHAFVEQEAFDMPWKDSLKVDADYLRNFKA